jgi:hypothetical protein
MSHVSYIEHESCLLHRAWVMSLTLVRAKPVRLDFWIFTVLYRVSLARPDALYQNYLWTVFLWLFYDIFVKRDIFVLTANSWPRPRPYGIITIVCISNRIHDITIYSPYWIWHISSYILHVLYYIYTSNVTSTVSFAVIWFSSKPKP